MRGRADGRGLTLRGVGADRYTGPMGKTAPRAKPVCVYCWAAEAVEREHVFQIEP